MEEAERLLLVAGSGLLQWLKSRLLDEMNIVPLQGKNHFHLRRLRTVLVEIKEMSAVNDCSERESKCVKRKGKKPRRR